MPRFIITLTICFLSLTSSALPLLPVKKIQQGELLHKAKAATLEEFFESWMDRNPKKAVEGQWFVLYKDEEALYWGWTTFKSLLSDDPTVKEFFKTPIDDIMTHFPAYEEVHGSSIREKLEEVILKSIAKQSKVTVMLGFSAVLDGDNIVIQTPCTIRHIGDKNSQKVNYNIILNKNTLELVKLEPI